MNESPNNNWVVSRSSTFVERVVITDFDMKFMSMVNFMVKWFFASIVAFIVVGILSIIPLSIILFLLYLLGLASGA